MLTFKLLVSCISNKNWAGYVNKRISRPKGITKQIVLFQTVRIIHFEASQEFRKWLFMLGQTNPRDTPISQSIDSNMPNIE